MAKTTPPPQTGRKKTSLYEMPGHLIRRVHQISVALFHQECAAFGITPRQYAVLRVLAAHDGVDQITVAGLAAFNRTTAGELVARLEKMHHLTREDNNDDRRLKNLFITRSGLGLIDKVDASVHRVQERLLEPLSKAERKRFIDYLARIAKMNNELSRAPLRPPRARKGS